MERMRLDVRKAGVRLAVMDAENAFAATILQHALVADGFEVAVIGERVVTVHPASAGPRLQLVPCEEAGD